MNSCLEDFIDIKVKEDIVKKAQDAGTALISLFRYLDGGLETSGLISVYGNPEMINKIYNMSLNINTALDVLERFRDFEKYDFKSVLNSEKDFAEAVRFLMTIDFQSYEPKFGSSVNKVIQHLSNADKQWIETAVKRLEQGEPIQYVLGWAWFGGLKFNVRSGVLIPRPETEWLVDNICAHPAPSNDRPLRILDIGTGSGCIALSIKQRLPETYVEAWDISTEALSIAAACRTSR